MASLLSLPFSIKFDIFSNLLTRDLKSARLVCRNLRDISERLMFRRIFLSNGLVETFAYIIQNPKLAAHVQELVWLEMPTTVDIYHQWVSRFKTSRRYKSTLELDSKLDSFGTRFEASEPVEIEVDDVLKIKETSALNFFLNSITLMPNLRKFVSQPLADSCGMGSGKVLGDRHAEYSMLDFVIETDIPNPGLYNFLLPAMKQTESKITSLIWDETTNFKGEHPLHSIEPVVFKNLTTITLKINSQDVINNSLCSRIAECLHTAAGLRELSIFQYEKWRQVDIFGELCRLLRQSCWEHLRVFESTDLFISNQDLIDFVERHRTLRRLSIWGRGCDLDNKTRTYLRTLTYIKTVIIRLDSWDLFIQ